MRTFSVAVSGVLGISGMLLAADSVLGDYVSRADASYRFQVVQEVPIGPATGYLVRLTSQTWRGREWWHWVTILVPPEVKHTSQAVLVIAGGSNRGGEPNAVSSEAMTLATIATGTGAVVAVVKQVPNQPLYGGLKEDALIAYSFERFLEEGDRSWPLLLPMVKSAVRAMDAVTDIVRQKRGLDIRHFIVTGASKRGWATYLTAAADKRVKAITPMVFDMLNMESQVRHQLQCYGQTSEMIHDYVERGIIDRMQTPPGQELLGIVDPYAYVAAITMPKLILLGTNDPYWTVDAANMYFPGLKGPTYLHYEPNAGHDLGPGVIPTVMAFLHAMLNDLAFPKLTWQTNTHGSLEVQWDDPNGRPVLYQALSPNRDFRRAVWMQQPLPPGQRASIPPPSPKEGWAAYFVQVEFPAPQGLFLPYTLSTTMTVLPAELPFPGRQAGERIPSD